MLDLQVRLRLQHLAHLEAVGLLVALRARRPHGRAAGGVEQAELDADRVGDLAHDAAERIHFADQVPLGNSPDRGIAGHLGLKTALYTLNLDLIAQMSCNPAIGGIAKGHLVREVDALGGIMGEVTDAVGIQFRLLNTSRGPAVWSPRAQCDKQAYRLKMREVLESQPNLKIKQAEVADLILEEVSAFGSRLSAGERRCSC